MRLAVFVLIGSAVLAQDTDTALGQIRAAEGNLRNAQFTMESLVYERTNDGELSPIDRFCNAEGLIASGGRARYRVRLHASLPEAQALSPGRGVVRRSDRFVLPEIARRQEISFDGTNQTIIDYPLESFESPTGSQVDSPRSWMAERGYLAVIKDRLTHVLPLYEGMGLAAYLSTIPEAAPDWKVVHSDDANRLTIWFPHANHTFAGRQDEMSYLVTLDLAHGGNIVEWKWYLAYRGQDEQLLASLEDVQLEQVEGHWLPVSFVRREYSYPKSGENVVREETRTKLTWSHVNAELGPDAFHVEYPGLKSGPGLSSAPAAPPMLERAYGFVPYEVDPLLREAHNACLELDELSESITDYRQAGHTEMGKTRLCFQFLLPTRA